jgi:hypothetical protein
MSSIVASVSRPAAIVKGEIERRRGRISFFIDLILVKLGLGEGNIENFIQA